MHAIFILDLLQGGGLFSTNINIQQIQAHVRGVNEFSQNCLTTW